MANYFVYLQGGLIKWLNFVYFQEVHKKEGLIEWLNFCIFTGMFDKVAKLLFVSRRFIRGQV